MAVLNTTYRTGLIPTEMV